MESRRHLSPVKMYFHFCFLAAIFNFGSRTTSGNIGGDIVKSDMVDNVGVAVGIAAHSLAVQKLFPLPVFAGRHLESVVTNVG